MSQAQRTLVALSAESIAAYFPALMPYLRPFLLFQPECAHSLLALEVLCDQYTCSGTDPALNGIHIWI